MKLILVFFLLVFLGGCSGQVREHPTPNAASYANAVVPGYRSNIRFWGDEEPPNMNEIIDKIRKNTANNPEWKERIDMLALSGGAEDGAYGAGFLKGWTESGKRPKFFMVTGVSTGALIAPFAFLGPRYDDAVKRFYTETSQHDLFFFTPLQALFGSSSLANTAPLRKIIEEEIDDELVKEIAHESRRGRLLLVGTTNLDAQRPVIWNIGEIAESGHPDAAKLIGDVILASASVPGAFPPVMQDVVIGGKHHQEIHVDGGVTNQIFVYPAAMNAREIQRKVNNNPRKRTFWLIRNSKIDPSFEATKLSLSDIASRSILTLLKYQGMGDLIKLAQLGKRDNHAVRITAVPEDFDLTPKSLFDPVYMKALYKVGYEKALSGQPWDDHLDSIFENTRQ